MIGEELNKNLPKAKIGYFPTFTGSENIYFKRVQFPATSKEPKVNIICVHEMAYHHESYDNFTNFLGQNLDMDFTLNFFDLKGHGLSNGVRAHVNDFDEYSLDLAKFLNMEFFSDDSKTIVIGNGMGALVILNLLFFQFIHLKRKINGVVLLNPMLKWNSKAVTWSMNLKKLLKKELQFIKYPFKIDGYDLMDDLSEAEKFNSDPLVNHYLTISLFSEIVNIGKKLRPFSYYIDVPCLFLGSANNEIVDSSSFNIFLKGINKSILEYELYGDLSHDLLNSKGRTKVFSKINSWVHQLSEGKYD